MSNQNDHDHDRVILFTEADIPALLNDPECKFERYQKENFFTTASKLSFSSSFPSFLITVRAFIGVVTAFDEKKKELQATLKVAKAKVALLEAQIAFMEAKRGFHKTAMDRAKHEMAKNSN